jgi:hypothetical protein
LDELDQSVAEDDFARRHRDLAPHLEGLAPTWPSPPQIRCQSSQKLRAPRTKFMPPSIDNQKDREQPDERQ